LSKLVLMIYCYKVKFCVNLEYDVLICYLVTSYCILKSTFDDLDWAETHLFIRKNSLSLSDYVDVFKSKSRNVLASCFAAVAEFKRQISHFAVLTRLFFISRYLEQVAVWLKVEVIGNVFATPDKRQD